MEFIEDLSEFMADFSVLARVGSSVVSGIFDAAEADTFGLVANIKPVLTVASKDVPTAAVGTAVVIGTTAYTIAELQPDGTGITRLMLK
jgi:hypothetical protein